MEKKVIPTKGLFDDKIKELKEKKVEKLISYYTIFIAKPFYNIDKQWEIYKKYYDLINQIGEIENGEKLGIKKLAYEVQGNKEGLWCQYRFKAKAGSIEKIERYYRLDDDIIKFMTIRGED